MDRIADEGIIKSKGYEFLYVTRSRFKDYVTDNNHGQPVIITDIFLGAKHQ